MQAGAAAYADWVERSDDVAADDDHGEEPAEWSAQSGTASAEVGQEALGAFGKRRHHQWERLRSYPAVGVGGGAVASLRLHHSGRRPPTYRLGCHCLSPQTYEKHLHAGLQYGKRSCVPWPMAPWTNELNNSRVSASAIHRNARVTGGPYHSPLICSVSRAASERALSIHDPTALRLSDSSA